MQPAQSGIRRGQTAQWTVTAWTRGGNVPDATIRLQAAPASLTPGISFGCGSHHGTSCDLGAVDASSTQRQLRAQVAVAASATAVTSVRLTAIANAAHLPKEPRASATVTVTAAPATPAQTSAPVTITSPLPVGGLPYLPVPSQALSPGGNAAGLFPALTPAPDPASGKGGTQQVRPVANDSASALGAPVVGAQLAGLGALALGFALVITRLSIRRRPAPAAPAEPQKPATGPLPPASAGNDTLES